MEAKDADAKLIQAGQAATNAGVGLMSCGCALTLLTGVVIFIIVLVASLAGGK